jgi:hypothetical protein
MNDKVYLARPNWAILDWMIMFFGAYVGGNFLEWFADSLPMWIQVFLFPFALAVYALIIFVAYKITIFNQCDGDYDNA